LTYHWNRWRSEDGSTFISEDPARDGSNWYGYCGNNPMTFTDPTGLELKIVAKPKAYVAVGITPDNFKRVVSDDRPKLMEALQKIAPEVTFTSMDNGDIKVGLKSVENPVHPAGYTLLKRSIEAKEDVTIDAERYLRTRQTSDSMLWQIDTLDTIYRSSRVVFEKDIRLIWMIFLNLKKILIPMHLILEWLWF
jgi:hypothetical protein